MSMTEETKAKISEKLKMIDTLDSRFLSLKFADVKTASESDNPVPPELFYANIIMILGDIRTLKPEDFDSVEDMLDKILDIYHTAFKALCRYTYNGTICTSCMYKDQCDIEYDEDHDEATGIDLNDEDTFASFLNFLNEIK